MDRYTHTHTYIYFTEHKPYPKYLTLVFGCLLYCFSWHTTFEVYPANSQAKAPCFGIRTQTFADAISCPGSTNREGLREAVLMWSWKTAWLSTLFGLAADVYLTHNSWNLTEMTLRSQCTYLIYANTINILNIIHAEAANAKLFLVSR